MVGGGHLLSNFYFRLARRRNYNSSNSSASNSPNIFTPNETARTVSVNGQMNRPPSELEGAVALPTPDSDTSMESLVSMTDDFIQPDASRTVDSSDISDTAMHLIEEVLEESQNNSAVSVSASVDAVSQTISNVRMNETNGQISTLQSNRQNAISAENILANFDRITVLTFDEHHEGNAKEIVKSEPSNAELSSRLPNYEVEAMGSVFREVFICPICQCEYCIDTDDPRTLNCGHSLCSICLQRLYDFDENEVECAECRKKASYVDIENIPIAFTIKQIIAKYKEKKKELDNPKTINEDLVICQDSNQEADNVTNEEDSMILLGNCEAHSLPIHFGCTSCEKWLCGTCVCLNHTNKNDSTCKVYQISEALQRKRNQLMDDLTEERENLRMKKLQEYQLKVDAKTLVSHAEELNLITQTYVKDVKQELELHENQEQRYKHNDVPIVNHLAKISSAKSPSEVKESIDTYFKYRESLNEPREKNDLFNLWRNFIHNASEVLEKQSSFAVSRKSSESEDSFVIVKAKKKEVLLEFTNKSTAEQMQNSGKLVMEVPFFNLKKNSYYAYITIGRRSEDEYARVTFLLDNNPLADAFLKKCSDKKCSFTGTRIFIPCRGSSSICFGQKIPTDSKRMVEIGDRNRYLKPISPGSVGVFNIFENKDEVDVNNMLVYINMLSSEAPRRTDIHYISYDGEPKLKMGFGIVYEGFDDLESFMDEPNELLTITGSGVFVALTDEDDE